MKLFFYFVMAFVFFSCKPNIDIPDLNMNPVKEALKAHIWLFDSLQAHYTDSISTIVESDPKLELSFTDTLSIIKVPSGSTDSLIYEAVEPNKLYQWNAWNGKDTTNVFIIETLTDASLVISSKQNDYTEYEFYHAK